MYEDDILIVEDHLEEWQWALEEFKEQFMKHGQQIMPCRKQHPLVAVGKSALRQSEPRS